MTLYIKRRLCSIRNSYLDFPPPRNSLNTSKHAENSHCATTFIIATRMTETRPYGRFVLLCCLVAILFAHTEAIPPPLPGICRRERELEGCRCYLRFIDVLFYSGPRDGKAFAFGIFCPKVPNVFPDGLKMLCSRFFRNDKLRVLKALRRINKYLKKCAFTTIKPDLPEGSKYCKFFE